MASNHYSSTTSFEDLNNDCISLVVKEVADPGHTYNRFLRGSRLGLKPLSLVNKRLRQLCQPLLFNFKRLDLGYRKSPSTQLFNDLVRATFVSGSLL